MAQQSPQAEQARALFAEGHSLANIARWLGRRPSVVQRWVNPAANAKHRADEKARYWAGKGEGHG